MIAASRQRAEKNVRPAMTLIELVVALALGALMMVVLLDVMRRAFAEINFDERSMPLAQSLTPVVEQLRRDCLESRQMRLLPTGVEFSGFCERDPVTMIATHRTARVVYEIRPTATHDVLVRIQSSGQPVANLESSLYTEPVIVGVSRLLVSSNQVGALFEAESLGGRSGSPAANEDQMPSNLRIVMLDRLGRVVIDQTILRPGSD